MLVFRAICLVTCRRFLAITRGEICDLLLAVNVVRLALEAEEDNRAQSGTARIALEHLEDMATQLKTKWHEDYNSLKELF